jgi:hypothetical protein
MSELSQPAFNRGLKALSAVLSKAEEHAAQRKIDPAVLIGARLFPDMLPFARQCQIACDFTVRTMARLSGGEPPAFPDTETSFAELRQRIERALDYVNGFEAARIDGSEERAISIPGRGETMTFTGTSYLLGFVLPNFYFHLATAYDILRHNGVEIGKRDFLGAA